MAPRTKFRQDKKAQPGEGPDRSNRTECQGKVQGLPGLFAEGLFRPELSPGQQMSQVADAAEKGSAESGGMTGLQADGQSLPADSASRNAD